MTFSLTSPDLRPGDELDPGGLAGGGGRISGGRSAARGPTNSEFYFFSANPESFDL